MLNFNRSTNQKWGLSYSMETRSCCTAGISPFFSNRSSGTVPNGPPLLAKVWQDLASRLQSFVSQKTKYGRYLEPVAVLKTDKVKSSQ